jgi:hypothetical protein
MLELFSAPGGGFYFTSAEHDKLPGRSLDPTDSALPSGNGVAVSVLVRLHGHTKEKKYLDAAQKTLESFAGMMQRGPAYTATMLLATGEFLESGRIVSVRVAPSQTEVRAGKTLKLVVTMNIDKGWHLNSASPLQKHLLPTNVSVRAGELVSIGKAAYPEGKIQKDLSIYEGRIDITVPVTISEKAEPGPLEITVSVQTQACSDSECLEPKTDEFVVRFEVVE